MENKPQDSEWKAGFGVTITWPSNQADTVNSSGEWQPVSVGSSAWLAGDYCIVTDATPYALERNVSFRIREGWQPIGGVAYGGDRLNLTWTQAMVKPANGKLSRRET